MKRSSRVALAVAFAILAADAAVGTQPLPELQSVSTVNVGGVITVVIEANGALPMPTAGAVENPPRIFFDFAGVKPRGRGIETAQGQGVVRQTRVALNATNITRVVLDLEKMESYRIDADTQELAEGRLKIVIGPETATASVAPLPPRPVVPPKPVERAETERSPNGAPSRAPATPAPAPAAKPPAAPPPPTSTAAAAPPPASTAATAPPPASTAAVERPPAATAAAPPTPPAASSPVPTPKASAATPAAAPPSPPASSPAPPAAPATTTARQRPMYTPPPSAPKLPSREIERYRQRLSGALERLEAQQPIVILLDAEGSISTEALQAALNEFTNLRRVLDGIKPSDALATTHELLIASCTLGATASRLGLEASRDHNGEARKNAASAAAGALMFFDRACADLGCKNAPQ